MVASKSLASLRLRPIQAKKRSTTQRRGSTANACCVLWCDKHEEVGVGDTLEEFLNQLDGADPA
jgi:hypothetical protein